MKKVLLILLAVLAVSLTGCKKETTCQVKNITGDTLYDVTIWEYNMSHEVINTQRVGTLHDSDVSSATTMAGATVSVKVAFRFDPSDDWEYTATRYPIADGKNTIITLTSSTILD